MTNEISLRAACRHAQCRSVRRCSCRRSPRVRGNHLERDVLPWARKYGIRICIDLHVPPGGCDETRDLHHSSDNPRKRALLEGLRKGINL